MVENEKNSSEYAQACLNKVHDLLKEQDNNFIRLGGYLIDCNSPTIYSTVKNVKTGKPCKNLCVLAKQEFGISKSSTYNLIKVCKRFGFMKSCLAEPWQEYNYSQLSEMVSLTDEQLKKCRPDMTVREIRFLKQVIKKQETQKVQSSGKNDINQEKPEFIAFKNDTERKNFLLEYKKWPLFAEFPIMHLKWYRAELENGACLMVTEYNGKKVALDCYGEFVKINYYQPARSDWNYYGFSDNEIITWLRQSKIKYKRL